MKDKGLKSFTELDDCIELAQKLFGEDYISDISIAVKAVFIEFGSALTKESIEAGYKNYYDNLSRGMNKEDSIKIFSSSLVGIAYNKQERNLHPATSIITFYFNWKRKEYEEKSQVVRELFLELVDTLKKQHISETEISEYIRNKFRKAFSDCYWDYFEKRLTDLIKQENEKLPDKNEQSENTEDTEDS